MNESSTQLQHWQIDSGDLLKRRQIKFHDAFENHVASRYSEQARKVLPIHEMLKEEEIVHYYLELLDVIAENTGDEAFAIAAVYFKRFYLDHSILKHDPHLFMLTCLYLATKTCESFKAIDKFIRDLPESARMPYLEKPMSMPAIVDSLVIERDHIEPMVQAEFELLTGLKFHLMVHVPHKPLYGFILDAETFIFNSIDRDTPVDLKKQLIDKLHTQSRKRIRHLFVHTDAALQFAPSQIAFYAFYVESQSLLIHLDTYMKARFSEAEREHLLQIVDQLQNLARHPPSSDTLVRHWTDFYTTHLPWYSLRSG